MRRCALAEVDEAVLNAGALLKNVISSLRDARNKNQIKPKEAIDLHIQSAQNDTYKAIQNILAKQINAKSISLLIVLLLQALKA